MRDLNHVRHMFCHAAVGLALGVLVQGCMTAPFDGMRVAERSTAFSMGGYILGPNYTVRVQARNPSNGSWVEIGRTTSSSVPSFVLADGNTVYQWTIPARSLSNTYWQSGTGGYFARTRAQVYYIDAWYNISTVRQDALGCILENWTAQGISENCFSHRGESYIYTENYSIAPASCPNPSGSTPTKNGHYLLENIPSCAQSIIYNKMKEKISRSMIDGHYQIEHNDPASAHATSSVTVGGRTYGLGGFFGGHEMYIRNMKRHVMVYDYTWMPKGEIPSWTPDTTIPSTFRQGVAAPNGDCTAADPAKRGPNCCSSVASGCTAGWYSGIVDDATPGLSRLPPSFPTNMCADVTSAAALHTQVNGWHGGVHCTVGNSDYSNFSHADFAKSVFCSSFDNPSFPLFLLWHNHVNDIWLDWKACGHPIP
ncbi:MAG: hypothetical protein OEZ06_31035 [Myxococcales bacterium]|nr:hypothetical protein [Myxococcales bacterium]